MLPPSRLQVRVEARVGVRARVRAGARARARAGARARARARARMRARARVRVCIYDIYTVALAGVTPGGAGAGGGRRGARS